MSERNPRVYSKLRMKLGPAYSLSNVLRCEPHMDALIQLLSTRLASLSSPTADGPTQNSKPVQLGKWLHYLIWDIMGELTFSTRFGFLDEGKDIGGSLGNTIKLAFYVTTLAYAQFLNSFLLDNPVLRWLDFQPNEHSFRTGVEAIEKRRRNKASHTDMMDYWLKLNDQGRLNDKEVFSAVMGNLGAGGDTVGSELQAFFYFLLRTQEGRFMARLKDEIDDAARKAELSDPIKYEEAIKLPFLQACVSDDSWSLDLYGL